MGRGIPHLARILAVVVCLCRSVPAGEGGNLLINGDFALWQDSLPKDWSPANNRQRIGAAENPAHPTAAKALRVDILRDGGSSYGEIMQQVAVEKGTAYRLTGDLRSSRGQTAFLQVKLVRDGKELARLSSDWSSPAWQRVTMEVNSLDAEFIQVLCRYRQKGPFAGVACYYANLSLTAIGPGAGTDPLTTKAVEELTGPIAEAPVELPTPAAEAGLAVSAPGADRYVTPTGAGNRTGADWDNALAAADGGLTRAWDEAGPGNTVFVGSGEYRDVTLDITAGGSGPGAVKRLQGTDTGAGLPLFTGSFDVDDPGKGWVTVINAAERTGFWEADGLRFRNCTNPVKLNGGHIGIRLSRLEGERIREGIVIVGTRDETKPEEGTHDVVVSDCAFRIYTKRGVRIRDGAYNLRFIRCRVDSGGQEGSRERFPIGFHLTYDKNRLPNHDVAFIDCTASGNWDPSTKGYRNADGFAVERNAYNVTYTRCAAYNNTDGGWDDKSPNPVLVDCVAMRNKRNFRFWSNPGPAVLTNCLSAFAVHPGTTKPGLGLWVASEGRVLADRCTFYANEAAVSLESDGSPTFAELRDCLLITRSGSERDLMVERPGEVRETGSVRLREDPASPLLRGPIPESPGTDGTFNPVGHPGKGCRYPTP